MNTGHTIAVTVLVMGLLAVLILHKSHTVGPIVNLGVGVGLMVGISSTWLLWQAVT